MSHYQKDADTEKGCVSRAVSFLACVADNNTSYSLRDGASFAEQARNVAFDLAGDEAAAQERQRRELKWDKKKKRFVKGTGEGADNMRLVRTESGVKLPATYRSGRFDEWKAKARVSLPKVGEAEPENARGTGSGVGPGGRKWKHKQVAVPKPLDKLRGDYERKVRRLKKVDGDVQGGGGEEPRSHGGSSRPPPTGKKVVGKKSVRFGGKPMGKVKSELKTVDQIRKSRKIMEQKRAKNARPTRRKGRR